MGEVGSGSDMDVYRRHAAELVQYATVLVGRTDAADVVEDAVLRAFAASGWADVTNRRAYLFRSVYHQSLMHRRSDDRRRRREVRSAASEVVAAADDAVDASIDAHRSLAQLTPQQRAVVYFTYWDDRSPAQIAELLAVGEGTVRKQLARARDHLRRIFDA